MNDKILRLDTALEDHRRLREMQRLSVIINEAAASFNWLEEERKAISDAADLLLRPMIDLAAAIQVQRASLEVGSGGQGSHTPNTEA